MAQSVPLEDAAAAAARAAAAAAGRDTQHIVASAPGASLEGCSRPLSMTSCMPLELARPAPRWKGVLGQPPSPSGRGGGGCPRGWPAGRTRPASSRRTRATTCRSVRPATRACCARPSAPRPGSASFARGPDHAYRRQCTAAPRQRGPTRPLAWSWRATRRRGGFISTPKSRCGWMSGTRIRALQGAGMAGGRGPFRARGPRPQADPRATGPARGGEKKKGRGAQAPHLRPQESCRPRA